jgi:outer membrane phospholipase A
MMAAVAQVRAVLVLSVGLAFAGRALAEEPPVVQDSPQARETGEAHEARQTEAGRAEAGAMRPSAEDPDASDRPDHLRIHRPNYLIFGFTSDTQVKFQFSFRYDLWPNREPWSIYLAYTQLSFWNLYSGSSPFEENNYSPELVTRWHFFNGEAVNGVDQILFGYQHESNGLRAESSRSWDRLFIEPRMVYYFGPPGPDSAALRVYLRLWWVMVSEQEDIYEFAGPGELIAAFSTGPTAVGELELDVSARKGIDDDIEKGRLQFGVRWKPPLPEAIRFTPAIYFQAHLGYFESLDSFDEKQQSFRLGLALPG